MKFLFGKDFILNLAISGVTLMARVPLNVQNLTDIVQFSSHKFTVQSLYFLL